jgi:transposase
VAPDVRPRRKRQSDFDPYAPYVLKRWEEGERNGTQLWQEIAAQGYSGSQRMVYRFLKTLKTHEITISAGACRLPHYSSTAAVCLFMRQPDDLDESERADLAAFRLAHVSFNTTYQLAQDFLVMMRQPEGERLDAWLTQVHESQLPELESFAHGVERDKAAVQAGLTLPINNGQGEGQVTRIKRDFAHDVRQSRFCSSTPTRSSSHLNAIFMSISFSISISNPNGRVGTNS